MPLLLLESAGIKEEALFVGQGRTFQIWSPDRYTPYKAGIESHVSDGEKSLSIFPSAEVHG